MTGIDPSSKQSEGGNRGQRHTVPDRDNASFGMGIDGSCLVAGEGINFDQRQVFQNQFRLIVAQSLPFVRHGFIDTARHHHSDGFRATEGDRCGDADQLDPLRCAAAVIKAGPG